MSLQKILIIMDLVLNDLKKVLRKEIRLSGGINPCMDTLDFDHHICSSLSIFPNLQPKEIKTTYTVSILLM